MNDQEFAKLIKDGDKVAFNFKNIAGEFTVILLWIFIMFLEYKEENFSYVWYTGIFFIGGLSISLVIRLIWFFYHITFNISFGSDE